jgi:hypothetical protein
MTRGRFVCPQCHTSENLGIHWELSLAIDDNTTEANLTVEGLDSIKEVLLLTYLPNYSEAAKSDITNNSTKRARPLEQRPKPENVTRTLLEKLVESIEREVREKRRFLFDPLDDI